MNEAHQRAEREVNLQRLHDAKTEITHEVNRLAVALQHAEQQVMAKSAVIASLQETVEAKNEVIASLQEALEPYEEKDMELRADVMLLERHRLEAEQMYLTAERTPGSRRTSAPRARRSCSMHCALYRRS